MRRLSSVLASVCLFSGMGFAADTTSQTDSTDGNLWGRHHLRYICESDDGDTFIRVFPNARYVEVRRTDGRPAYNMGCELDRVNWLDCTGDDGRKFIFHRGGRSGVYFGSVRDTPVTCQEAGH